MRSDVVNERQETAKSSITIFAFVLTNNRLFKETIFLVWIYIFIHIYKIQKQISGLPSINVKVSLPVSSNKVRKILEREGSFDIFIKLYDETEQIFNIAVKFLWNPNPGGNHRWC